MKILDLSSGNRGIWFDKNRLDTLFLDCREEVSPSIVADSRRLPFPNESGFNLFVFDPPHTNFGANSNMARDYGHHTGAGITSILSGTAKESHRVGARDALMAFKWNDHARKLTTVLPLFSPWWEPLFGQQVSERTARGNKTYWVLLKRVGE